MESSIRNVLFSYRYYILGNIALALLIKWCKSYFGGGVCKSKARLDGKTVIITGANTGIGKETAVDLAKRGARVILACRDKSRAEKAADDIRKESGNGNVVVELVDLASIESIKKFSNKINAQEERIDVLINNAGVIGILGKTAEGFEMTFGVNHLGHFVLTKLLLDKIKNSAPSRIINVSSKGSESGRMNWDDIMFAKGFNSFNVYGQSKLANVLFTRELAKRLQNTGVTTYSLHPGVVSTEIQRHLTDRYPVLRILNFFFQGFVWIFGKTSQQGAQTTIYCAVDESLKIVSGRYYSDCKEKQLLPHALNDEDAIRLWKLSEELTNKFL